MSENSSGHSVPPLATSLLLFATRYSLFASMKQDVAPVSRPLDAAAAALAVVLCLSWGFNQVAIKLALPEIPPLIQAAFRSTFGAIVVVRLVALRAASS